MVIPANYQTPVGTVLGDTELALVAFHECEGRIVCTRHNGVTAASRLGAEACPGEEQSYSNGTRIAIGDLVCFCSDQISDRHSLRGVAATDQDTSCESCDQFSGSRFPCL
jgi:hypothetical protein